MQFISLFLIIISTSSLYGYRINPPTSRTISLQKEVKDIQCRRFRSSFILRNDLLGEEIKELREGDIRLENFVLEINMDNGNVGIDIFQKETFKALYDGKQVKWEPKTIAITEVKSAVAEEVATVDSTIAEVDAEVLAVPTDSPVSAPVPAAAETSTPASAPIEASQQLENPQAPAASLAAPVEASIPIEKVPAPTPTSKAVEKAVVTAAVATPPPVEKLEATVIVSQVKREVAPEALILKDVPIDSTGKKDEGVPSTEDVLRAQQAVAKTFLNILSEVAATGKQESNTEPPLAKVEASQPLVEKVAPTLAAKVSAPKPVVLSPSSTPAPAQTTSKSGESAFENLFGFLKSDPNVMLAAQSRAQSKPTAPPAVARALSQSPKSVASVKEEDTPLPKSQLLTIADARKEAAKAKDVPVVAAATKPSITTPASGSTGGLFDFFSPKLPAPEKKEPSPAIATKTTTAPATPAVKASAVPINTVSPTTTKASSASGGGFFGFLTSTPPPEKEPAPSVAVATKATVKTQAPVAPVVKASVVAANTVPPATAKPSPPSGGGLFGFLASSPAPEKKESAPAVAVATKVSVKTQAPVAPVVKASAIPKTVPPVAAKASPAGGGLFGFLASSPAPEKKEPAPAIAKATLKTPAPVAPVVKVNLPVKTVPPKTTPVTATTKTSSTSGGGFFGFLASNPAPEAKEPAPSVAVATKATVKTQAPVAPVVKVGAVAAKSVPPATTKPSSPTGGGFFGFLASTPAPEKKEPAPVAAVATKVSVKTQAPVAPVVKASAAPIKTVPPVAAKASPSGGGLFGFLASSPAPEKKEPAPDVAVATKAAEKTVKPAPVTSVVKPSTVAPKSVPPVTSTTKATPSSGGFFGFLASTPAPEKKESAPAIVVATKATEKAVKTPAPVTPAVKVVAPTAAKAKVEPAKVATPKPATTMNAKFTSTVSEALKKDSTKIGLFQTATDNFRSGNSDATSFLASLEKLFGSNPALLDSIVPQLIAELPEKKVAEQLKIVYEKKVVVAKAAASKLPLPIKAPAKVPTLQKALVENQLKAIIAGTTQAESFFTLLEKELGRTRLKEISEELLAMLPKDKADKVRAVFQARKL